jgi:hypothetical protein
MDACDPDTDIGNIRNFIKFHTGQRPKISREKLCEISRNIKMDRLPLPPLVLSRDKKYMIDSKSPLTQKDYERLFSSSVKSDEMKRIARKTGLTEVDKTISELKNAVGRRLRSMNVREPVQLHSKRHTIVSAMNTNGNTNENRGNRVNTSGNTNENRGNRGNTNENRGNRGNTNENRGNTNENRGNRVNTNENRGNTNENRGNRGNTNENRGKRVIMNNLQKRRRMSLLQKFSPSPSTKKALNNRNEAPRSNNRNEAPRSNNRNEAPRSNNSVGRVVVTNSIKNRRRMSLLQKFSPSSTTKKTPNNRKEAPRSNNRKEAPRPNNDSLKQSLLKNKKSMYEMVIGKKSLGKLNSQKISEIASSLGINKNTKNNIITKYNSGKLTNNQVTEILKRAGVKQKLQAELEIIINNDNKRRQFIKLYETGAKTSKEVIDAAEKYRNTELTAKAKKVKEETARRLEELNKRLRE